MRKTRCRPLVDNEISRKVRLHENEVYKGECPSKISMVSSSSNLSSIYSSVVVVTQTVIRIKKEMVRKTKVTVFNRKIPLCEQEDEDRNKPAGLSRKELVLVFVISDLKLSIVFCF